MPLNSANNHVKLEVDLSLVELSDKVPALADNLRTLESLYSCILRLLCFVSPH